MFEVLIFKIQIFQMTSDGETTKTKFVHLKVIELEKYKTLRLRTYSFEIIYGAEI